MRNTRLPARWKAAPSALLALTGLVISAACSQSTNNPPPLKDVDGGGRDVRILPFDGAIPEGSTGLPDGGDAASMPLGPIPIVDEPDTPCMPKGGTSVVVYGADAGPNAAPTFARMQTVGTRRVAGSEDIGGFVTFDAVGTNPDSMVVSLGTTATEFVSEGATIGAVGTAKDLVQYQRYDGMQVLIGSAVQLENDTGSAPPTGLSIGAGTGGTLVAWGRSGYDDLQAAGVTTQGAAAGAVFTVTMLPGLNELTSATAATGNNFAIVWATPAANGTQASFVTASLTGLLTQPVGLATSGISFQVSKLVPLSGGGYALLLNGGVPTTNVYVVILDMAGKVMGSAHHFLGATSGWDIAVQGSTLGLVTNRASGEPEFRPLDATGTPSGPWVCLDGPLQPSQLQGIAIDTDGTGFAVIYRNPANQDVLVRFSTTGQ